MLTLVVLALAASQDPQTAKVYYGVAQGAKKPGEVVASKVFDEIPEFQKIKEKGLTSDDPEYFILLTKANTRFYAAVMKAAMAATCDVVVEKGTGTFTGAPADLTKKAIDSIDK